MTLRSLICVFALAGVCLLGCNGDDKKKDDPKDKSAKKDATAKHEAGDADKKPAEPKQPEPVDTAQYEPFDAQKWAPDPGKADPNAWKPQDSKLGTVSGAIFNAFKRAAASSDETENQP